MNQSNQIESIKHLTLSLECIAFSTLIQLCKKFGIPCKNCTKNELIQAITERYYDVKKYIKYRYIHQLGREGKDGRTFLAVDDNGNEVAIKIFSKKKSSASIIKEAKLQMIAAQHGIAPQVIDYDGDGKYIIMEKMDINLFDCFRQQNGQLTKEQQKALIHLFKKLDECKVFHGDPNPLNFMQKNGRWYVIDFGFSKPINSKTIPKYGETPNMTYMPLGFKLKITKIYSECRLKYIDRYC